jgi:hypothetical protein
LCKIRIAYGLVYPIADAAAHFFIARVQRSGRRWD